MVRGSLGLALDLATAVGSSLEAFLTLAGLANIPDPTGLDAVRYWYNGSYTPLRRPVWILPPGALMAPNLH
ncbi:hypothetical protein VTN77DRAFT_6062 [Rasamsonia byssochlamydoides]|uniref:uncharacterized protein n=1 Tax=Rasamsonia byssochlamydoides TaxID=89139 RepID=UPI003742FF0E